MGMGMVMGRPSSGKQLNGVYMGMGGHPQHHHHDTLILVVLPLEKP